VGEYQTSLIAQDEDSVVAAVAVVVVEIVVVAVAVAVVVAVVVGLGSLEDLDPEETVLASDMVVSFQGSYYIVVVVQVVHQDLLGKGLYLESWKLWVSVHRIQDMVAEVHLGRAWLGSLDFGDIPDPYFVEAYPGNFVECLVAYYHPYYYCLDMGPCLVENLVENTQVADKVQVFGHKDD